MDNKTNGKTKDESKTDEPTNALLRRANRRKNRGNGETADWISATSALIAELIGTVSYLKGTITFGYTRDGGAYFISYYFGEESERVYCRPAEGIDSFLEDEIASFE